MLLVGEGALARDVVDGVSIECLSKPNVYLLGTLLFQWKAMRFALSQMTQFDVLLFHQMSALWLLPLLSDSLVTRW